MRADAAGDEERDDSANFIKGRTQRVDAMMPSFPELGLMVRNDFESAKAPTCMTTVSEIRNVLCMGYLVRVRVSDLRRRSRTRVSTSSRTRTSTTTVFVRQNGLVPDVPVRAGIVPLPSV
eukprot:scaffold570018_cov14-Prasinocladus_malaysianus.AAC.1